MGVEVMEVVTYVLFCDKCDDAIRETDFRPNSNDIVRWGAEEREDGEIWCGRCTEGDENDDR